MSTLVVPDRESLRERNKAKRRNAVLNAALDVLGGPEPASMTTERIAQLAEVSVATVYNLVGTREDLLMALVDRLIENLVQSMSESMPTDDPIAALRRLIQGSVEVLAQRPTAYRQVVLQLTAAANGDLHTKLNPSTAASAAFERAQQRGTLRADLDPSALAMQVYLSYNGALLRWAAGGLTDAGFSAAAVHGLDTVVAAGATTRSRSAALANLRKSGAGLVRSQEASGKLGLD